MACWACCWTCFCRAAAASSRRLRSSSFFAASLLASSAFFASLAAFLLSASLIFDSAAAACFLLTPRPIVNVGMTTFFATAFLCGDLPELEPSADPFADDDLVWGLMSISSAS